MAQYQLTLDPAGQITQEVSDDGTTTYSYDATGQLTGAVNSSQPNESYSYDANGNRTNSGYVTGPDNELLSDGTYNYTYDADGNRISQTDIATGTVTDYQYDNRNRLTAVIVKDASGTVIQESQYTYDVFDNRIGTSYDSDGSGPAPPVVERFVYDRGQIDLVFDGSGNQTDRYLYGPAVDEVLADENAMGQIFWDLGDYQGTIKDVVDSNGVVQDHLVYSSFGQIISQTNPSLQPRFTYTGRETDPGTGLDYYRARYYDPAVGRFISQDPSGLSAGDVNLYRYAGNSPTVRIDPSGLRDSNSSVTSDDVVGAIDSSVQFLHKAIGTAEARRVGWLGRVLTFEDSLEKNPDDSVRAAFQTLGSEVFGTVGAEIGGTVGLAIGVPAGFAAGEFFEPLGGGFPGAAVVGLGLGGTLAVAGNHFGGKFGEAAAGVTYDIAKAAFDRGLTYTANAAMDLFQRFLPPRRESQMGRGSTSTSTTLSRTNSRVTHWYKPREIGKRRGDSFA